VVSVADYIFAYFRVDSTFALFVMTSQITNFFINDVFLITLKDLSCFCFFALRRLVPK